MDKGYLYIYMYFCVYNLVCTYKCIISNYVSKLHKKYGSFTKSDKYILIYK